MAFTGNAVCVSYLKELLTATHNHSAAGGDTFKLALFTDVATLNKSTTAYSSTNEVTGTGYSAGGVALTNIEPTSGSTKGYTQFADALFTNVSLTARGGLIFNSSKGNKAVMVIDFGANKTIVSIDFVVQMPLYDEADALIRLTSV